jgi:hypothetical protein
LGFCAARQANRQVLIRRVLLRLLLVHMQSREVPGCRLSHDIMTAASGGRTPRALNKVRAASGPPECRLQTWPPLEPHDHPGAVAAPNAADPPAQDKDAMQHGLTPPLRSTEPAHPNQLPIVHSTHEKGRPDLQHRTQMHCNTPTHLAARTWAFPTTMAGWPPSSISTSLPLSPAATTRRLGTWYLRRKYCTVTRQGQVRIRRV